MTLLVDGGPRVAPADPHDRRRLVVRWHLRRTRIQTFDERNVRAIGPLHGDACTLQPADA